jgi:gliding motility-associated-like protein
VLDRTQPPVVLNPNGISTLDCGLDQATLQMALSGTMTGGVRYLIQRYPPGTAFTPTNAITINVNPILSGTTASLVLVSKSGEYVYVVTNTLTGCKAQATITVMDGALSGSMTADPETGYAPLNVNFTNNSSSSLGSGSITSVWSFGNGTSMTTTNNAAASVMYNSPGTYTAALFISKGSCKDTVYKVIRVENPSKMEVPNIFTPNADGSNDVFLKASGLSEISAVIIDRWGNKVYETSSKTGNIAWDGKNFAGKECAQGVYMYIIKAKGKDDKEYEQKGNVTLMR